MTYRVVFSPAAEGQLVALYHYIAAAASAGTAISYVEAIVRSCEGLGSFPHRGHTRDDVRPGLRIINYRRRAVIAFDVAGDVVSVIGVLYGGQG
jgi:plasmid stabilization system protein ParE